MLFDMKRIKVDKTKHTEWLLNHPSGGDLQFAASDELSSKFTPLILIDKCSTCGTTCVTHQVWVVRGQG